MFAKIFSVVVALVVGLSVHIVSASAAVCDKDLPIQLYASSTNPTVVRGGSTKIRLVAVFDDSECPINIWQSPDFTYRLTHPRPPDASFTLASCETWLCRGGVVQCESSPCFISVKISAPKDLRLGTHRVQIVAGQPFGNFDQHINLSVKVNCPAHKLPFVR